MAMNVKGKRRYDSPRRREQAEGTRRAILEAAQRLFERNGYAATSVAAIAAEAGVTPKTVYSAFETKSGLLRALWHMLLRGDQAEVPVGERQWFRDVLDEPDPVRQLELNARNSRVVKVRIGPLTDVIQGGAASDPEVAALWERMQTEFYENQLTVVKSLDAKGALRSELDVNAATDILWTLNHPTVYGILNRRLGWTPERFERWLAEITCSQLLADSAAGDGVS